MDYIRTMKATSLDSKKETPYERYFSLNSNGSDQTCLSDRYKTLSELGSKKIVWCSSPAHYRVYNNITCLRDAIEQMDPEERCFHEVILEGPQKLKFDIDAKAVALMASQVPGLTAKDKYNTVKHNVIEAINDVFFCIYDGRNLESSNIILCESFDKTGEKYSAHIIVNGYYVGGSAQCREFTKKVTETLPRSHVDFLDQNINKTNQNFRLPLCHKSDDMRVKDIMSNHTWEQALITNVVGCVKLTNVVEESIKKEIRIYSEDVTNALKICERAGILKDFTYRNSTKNTLNFDRIRPSYCEFCAKVHDADNTQKVTLHPQGHRVEVVLRCRRIASEYKVLGYMEASNPTMAGLATEHRPAYMESLIRNEIEKSKGTAMVSQFDSLPLNQKHIYSEPSLRPFELTDTLVVHAHMKMGKTKTLKEYLEKFYPKGVAPSVVRFVSFRRTFSATLKANFPGFDSYDELKGDLLNAWLIVQVESLHRLSIVQGQDPPDLLILDECESIFEQFNAGLQRNVTCFANFQYLLRFSKRVICMDAYISDRTFNILKLLRPGSTDKLVYHRNIFQNGIADKYFITSDKTQWINCLCKSVEKGERIVVPMSSREEAETLETLLRSRYIDRRIQLYSGQTPTHERREHFNDVNRYWKEFDILIYTPTVSAGLSFEEVHFDKLFGYFTDTSCPVETCMQMNGRVRNLTAKEYVICLSTSSSYYPTTHEDIVKSLHDSRSALFKSYGEFGFTCEFNEFGGIVLHESDFFKMWVENTRIINLSKMQFVRRFIKAAGAAGASISYMSDDVYKYLSGESIFTSDGQTSLREIEFEHSSSKQDIRERNILQIVSAADITADDHKIIATKLSSGSPVTKSELGEIDRFNLREWYGYTGHIDDDFVNTYIETDQKVAYKNLNLLYKKDTIEKSLARLQIKEANKYRNIMSYGPMLQQHDLTDNLYEYTGHNYAMTMMRACGWQDMMDCTRIGINTIGRNVEEYFETHLSNEWSEDETVENYLIKFIRKVNDHFNFKSKSMKDFYPYTTLKMTQRFIYTMNKVFGKLYLHSVRKCRDLVGMSNSSALVFDKGRHRWNVIASELESS